MASSRAGGAVRTGPRGPRPFSRSRICLSGNPAPPQDGVGPGAQAAPGTAPSPQAPRPSLSAPSAGQPGEGERTTDPGGPRAVPLAPHPRGRGVRRAGSLGPPWVGGRSTPLGGAKGGDHPPTPPPATTFPRGGPSLRGEASPSSSGSFPAQDSRQPRLVWSDAQSLHLRNGHTDASGWAQPGRTREADHLLQPWLYRLAE